MAIFGSEVGAVSLKVFDLAVVGLDVAGSEVVGSEAVSLEVVVVRSEAVSSEVAVMALTMLVQDGSPVYLVEVASLSGN